MPRFLVGITHQVYRHRVFAIAGAITALFLMLLAVLPALFAFDPKLSNAVPAYSEVSGEVVDALVHSSSLPLLVAAIVFSIWGVSVYLRCLDYVLRRRLVAIATICALWMIEVILKYKSFTPAYASLLWYGTPHIGVWSALSLPRSRVVRVRSSSFEARRASSENIS